MSNRYQYRPGPDGIGNLEPVRIGEPLDDELPIIFLYCEGQFGYGKGFYGTAMAQDGTVLNVHRSTALVFLKTDLLSRRRFNAHYCDGWQTEWVDNPDTHEGLRRAQRRHEDAGNAVTARDRE